VVNEVAQSAKLIPNRLKRAKPSSEGDGQHKGKSGGKKIETPESVRKYHTTRLGAQNQKRQKRKENIFVK